VKFPQPIPKGWDDPKRQVQGGGAPFQQHFVRGMKINVDAGFQGAV